MNYLSKFRQLVFLTIAVVLFTSCSKEQSYFNIEDIKGRATIVGYLYYNEGQTFVNNKYEELNKNAVGFTVYADVANEDIKASSSGRTTYSCTTGEDGKFTMTVPVTPDGVRVRIRVQDKEGKHYVLNDVNNNTPIFKEEDGFYGVNSEEFTLSPGTVQVFDKELTFTPRNEIVEYKEYAQYQIRLGKCMFDNGNYRTIYPASSSNVIIKVDYQNGQSRYYGATSDYNGHANFKIPFPELPYTANISLESVQSLWEYAYYYDGIQYNGYYSVYNRDVFRNSQTDFTEFDNLVIYHTVRMEFNPVGSYDENLSYIFDAGNWNTSELWPNN